MLTPNTPAVLKKRAIFSLFMILAILAATFTPLGVGPALAIDAPVPISPAYGTVTTMANYPPIGIPTFEWSAVAGATIYRLELADNIGFNPIQLTIDTRNTRFTPSAHIFNSNNWYWRVRVQEPQPVSNFSTVMQFTRNWASAETAPIIKSPSNGAMMDFYTADTFSWEFVTGASLYRFQIAATPAGFGAPIYSAETFATTHQPITKLANGTYYWRVLPLDFNFQAGASSEVRSFTLAYGTSAFSEVPIQLTPEPNSTPTFTPAFSWTAVKGADRYRLEYTTDENCDYSTGTAIETYNTTYTPTGTFSNDARYCWHVRAQSGFSIGDWSPTWYFTKHWYIQPTPLTPTNNYKYGLYPVYSWTPVPGAAYYQIEIALDGNFMNVRDVGTTANTYYTPRFYLGTPGTPYYWRVTPYDNSGFKGKSSTVFSWLSNSTYIAPSLIYPFYYFTPNNYSGQAELQPHEDRTVAYPIFLWHRLNRPYSEGGGTLAEAYRIEVATTPYFAGDTVWSYDTENTSATPTVADPFTPVNNQDYFWRVCPLDSLGGNCLIAGDGDPYWSQAWRTRFDSSLSVPPTSGTPVLMRPEHGQEVVEATPLLEWFPVTSADRYQVQISRDPAFGSYEVQAEVSIPAYSPPESIAQRFLDRLDFGTFYWRVQARVGGTYGAWSEIRRFQIASQSEWMYTRTIGDTANRLQIGSDPDDVTDNNYEVTTLSGAQSNSAWYFGFNATMGATDMVYVLYIDLDHIDGSGATAPPSEYPYTITTTPAHQPEYAVFIKQVGGIVSKANTWVFHWEGTGWSFGTSLGSMGGGDLYNSGGFVELQIPATAIGMNTSTYSASVMLFSVNTTTQAIQDSVPSDPQAPGTGYLTRFTGLTDRVNLIYPPTNSGGDPTEIPSFVPFFWDYATGDDGANPWAGARVHVCVDELCTTNPPGQFDLVSDTPYFGMADVAMLSDLAGDTTYYWRVLQRYRRVDTGEYYEGAWTSGFAFEREGFTPQNLQTSVNFATPTFSWDWVEGAASYDLLVSTDPNLQTGIVINANTASNQFVLPNGTLPEDDYYWTVRARRWPGVTNDWANPAATLVLSRPRPSGLTINDADNSVHYAPTMCWNHTIGYDDTTPVLAAYRYRLQIAVNSDFTSQNIWETIDTEQTCYTPNRGMDDRTYYWRVAIIDGGWQLGGWSEYATFTKQYPVTTLISPLSSVSGTPTFKWTPVDGAASYRLEVSLNPNFSGLIDSAETVNTQYTPQFLYEQFGYTTYYWRVAIRDRDGRVGPYTGAILIGDVYQVHIPMLTRK